jgi:chromosome segregation ATPase
MNTDDGNLSFGTAIDMSGFDEGITHIENKVSEIGDKAEAESARFTDAFAHIPTVKIDVVTNAAQSLKTIDAAFEEIDRVVDTNKAQIKELEDEYKRLSEQSAQAFNSGADKEARAIQQDMRAVKELIKARKDAIKEAEKTADDLLKVEQKLKDEAAASAKAATSSSALRTHLRELTMQLVELEAQGKRGTDEFNALQAEAAELADRISDARQQVRILSNDQSGFQGMMSVMSGVSGGFTALTGAMSLFGSENEDLQRVMMKLQSVMAITMGLQQVQQMLNKDSAASLVVLNGLKEWWRKITIQATGAQQAEAAATIENTAAQEANTVAEEVNAAAHTANAAATEAETVADTAQAAASGAAAAAEGVQTAAIGAETTAAVAGTAANWSLAAAFRAVGLAIKSIPVFGWILAGISALIGLVSMFTDTEKENTEAIEENKQKIKEQIEEYNARERVMKEAASISAKEKAQVETLSRVVHDNTIKLEDRKKALAELNRIVPKYNGLLSNEGVLIRENTQAIDEYIAALDRLALAKALQNELEKLSQKEVENQIRQRRAQRHIRENSDYPNPQQDYLDLYHASSTDEFNRVRQQQNEKLGERLRAALEGDILPSKEALEAAQQDLKDAKKEAKEIAADKEDLLDMIRESGLQGEMVTTIAPPKPLKFGGSGGNGGGNDTFDPEQAALDQKEALDAWKEAVKRYIADAEGEVSDYSLEKMAEGQARELARIDANAEELKSAWIDKLRGLAEARMRYDKEVYMSQKGATEVGWSKTANGQKTIEDYAEELMKEKEIAEAYSSVLTEIEAKRLRERKALQQQYTDAIIDSYGTTEQKIEKLTREWMAKIAALPQEYKGEAAKQMASEIQALRGKTDFKDLINWESVFGDLGKQSMESLEINLNRIRKYFEENKSSMDAKEIKEYTDAIKQMEDEIAGRNPFSAIHKSLKDISASKTELIAALAEFNAAQQPLKDAQAAYNDELDRYNEIKEAVDSGEMLETDQKFIDATLALESAQNRLNQAEEKSTRAENNVINSRNNLTHAYKSFASSLKNAGGVIKDVGGKAKNLAKVFSDDVADSIEKGLDFVDEILDATSSVIDAISDVGKSAAKGVESTVNAAAQGSTAAAAAGATAISTIEKASVILAVISAALQVATAIANLFNDDDSKQKEIEHLQERIDQLRWELDNQDAVRLQEKYGDAVQRVRDIYNETLKTVWELRRAEVQGNDMFRYIAAYRLAQNEAYAKSVEKIADAYAKIDYTANKALGEDKYKSSRKQLENLAEQQLLLQKQIDAENDKKKTDHGKIEDWKREIQELANEMAEIINEMMEDIIGTTAQDLAQELGDAFFDAAAQGEDAMEAWHQKVNDIVRDILKRMMITQFLEPAIGKIFDKYKKIWFDEKGNFQGINVVKNSANSFANDLNQAGEQFSEIYDALNQGMKDLFEEGAEREGESRGIATASQDSVDENNARLTTIQGHTYSLVQGMNELNATGSQILARVTGIEKNTDETNTKLDSMNTRIKRIEDDVNDIQMHGITIKV